MPLTRGGVRVELRLWVSEPEQIVIDPYPFDEPAGFEVAVPARGLEDRSYGSAQEAAAAFHGTPANMMRVRVAPPGDP